MGYGLKFELSFEYALRKLKTEGTISEGNYVFSQSGTRSPGSLEKEASGTQTEGLSLCTQTCYFLSLRYVAP